jgi:hypothetical protein
MQGSMASTRNLVPLCCSLSAPEHAAAPNIGSFSLTARPLDNVSWTLLHDFVADIARHPLHDSDLLRGHRISKRIQNQIVSVR